VKGRVRGGIVFGELSLVLDAGELRGLADQFQGPANE
jgi:hypothetical protein